MVEIIPNWHPLFVHFPIAYATAALFFLAAGKLGNEKSWATQCLTFARWMLWAAAIFAGIAAVFGWFAYNSVDHDEAGHLAMTTHRNWALATVGALLVLTVLDLRSWRATLPPSYGFLLLMMLSWTMVVSTAWHGGEVVYRHGLGVMSLPEVEGPGHPHEHGAGHEHGDIPAQAGNAPPVPAGNHEEMAPGAHSQAVGPDGQVPAGQRTPAKKHAHTHAPGTPPHRD